MDVRFWDLDIPAESQSSLCQRRANLDMNLRFAAISDTPSAACGMMD